MIQIAIGEPGAWTVLDGAGVALPFVSAAMIFNYSSEERVREKVEMRLSGTPAHLSAALAGIETIRLRALAYARGEFAFPQYLRFKPADAEPYYYAQMDDLLIETNPDAYITRQKGSLLITLHYTRPNHFDSDEIPLPLTGRIGEDLTTPIPILNHTSTTSSPSSTLLAKAEHAVTHLPAPLRIELTNTRLTSTFRSLFIGLYHHPTHSGDENFFVNAGSLTGGTLYPDAGAIDGYYRRVTWTSSARTDLLSHPIPPDYAVADDGRTFRPLLHLRNTHVYNLHLRLSLIRGGSVLQTCEPVYSPPNCNYVLFPPLQIPPNQLLRELSPLTLDLQLSGLRESGAASTLDVDQIALFPLDGAAYFQGFTDLDQHDVLIDDSHRGISVVRDENTHETVAHLRQGGPLLLYPNENTRFFFAMINGSNWVDMDQTASVQIKYRPRVRVL